MARVLISETLSKIGQEVELFGWVHVKREHGKITFLDLRDRSGIVQVVGEASKMSDLKPEWAVKITGKVNKRPENLINPKLETGSVEVECKEIEILAKAKELPFDMGKEELGLQLPTLLDYRTITLRNVKIADIFRVQEKIMQGFREASQKLGCMEVFTPTISVSSSEGGAEVFKVDYYGFKASLIQSPQLYKQMLIPAFERVYLVSRAYREEPSVTTRHLSESIQMDCEMGFVNFGQLLDALEFVGVETLKHVSAQCGKILKRYNIEDLKLDKKVPRLTMREAQEIIKKRTGVDHTDQPDLMPEDEREIGKWALEEKQSDLVTITHYPTVKRAFYTMPDPENPEYSLSYDLLFKGMEVLSGSQRINDYDQLVSVIEKRGMHPKDFQMYLQAFSFGMPPEGGFSFGLERMTMQILGLSNIREASLFPRDMERIDLRLSEFKSSKKRK